MCIVVLLLDNQLTLQRFCFSRWRFFLSNLSRIRRLSAQLVEYTSFFQVITFLLFVTMLPYACTISNTMLSVHVQKTWYLIDLILPDGLFKTCHVSWSATLLRLRFLFLFLELSIGLLPDLKQLERGSMPVFPRTFQPELESDSFHCYL